MSRRRQSYILSVHICKSKEEIHFKDDNKNINGNRKIEFKIDTKAMKCTNEINNGKSQNRVFEFVNYLHIKQYKLH